MSRRKPLTVPGDTAYRYDGSIHGLYCCVHACVYSGRMPVDVIAADEEAPSLLPAQEIKTDAQKAQRVRDALAQKVCPRARELLETVFLSAMPRKGLPLVRFAVRAFEQGRQIVAMLQHPDVSPLLQAEQHLLGEAHLLKGFVRFSDYQGRLIATIRPKNFVLPFLVEHFAERYACEEFLIFDRTHRAALVWAQGQAHILPMEEAPVFGLSDEEALYRALWKQFYHTIAIQARVNPTCRRTHMPMRYWSEMTEMCEELAQGPRPIAGGPRPALPARKG